MLVHETHALGVKVDRSTSNVVMLTAKVDQLADSMNTMKSIVGDMVKLATSHERRISTLEGSKQ